MSLLAKVLREPLVHFLLIGACLFALFGLNNGPQAVEPNRIVITTGQQQMLAERFSRARMRPPSADEQDALVETYLRDEVFFREAIALGLDKGDDLIRRRMRQKLNFILEDVSALTDPTDEELNAFMAQYEDRYRQEPRITFEQIYLSLDARQNIEADAREIIAQLKSGANPEQLGDRIMLARQYTKVSPSIISRSFGGDFAQQVARLTPGVWSGPLTSGFGAHVVLVSEYLEGRKLALSEVKDAVLRDWVLERQKELEEITYRKLLAGYDVVLEAVPAASPNDGTTPDASEPGQ